MTFLVALLVARRKKRKSFLYHPPKRKKQSDQRLLTRESKPADEDHDRHEGREKKKKKKMPIDIRSSLGGKKRLAVPRPHRPTSDPPGPIDADSLPPPREKGEGRRGEKKGGREKISARGVHADSLVWLGGEKEKRGVTHYSTGKGEECALAGRSWGPSLLSLSGKRVVRRAFFSVRKRGRKEGRQLNQRVLVLSELCEALREKGEKKASKEREKKRGGGGKKRSLGTDVATCL